MVRRLCVPANTASSCRGQKRARELSLALLVRDSNRHSTAVCLEEIGRAVKLILPPR
jgi:hypothetical protein